MVFLDAHGQQNSRNLMAEYCASNWKVDPVKCADYVPKGYQVQQNQGIGQNPVQHNSANDASRICPLGSYLGKDSFGNQACLDSKTNQFVSSPNTGQSYSGNNGTIIGIVVFIIIIAIIAGVAKSRGKSTTLESGTLARRHFSQDVRDMTLQQQEGKCAMCGRHASSYQFDHIDGDHSNNSPSNCQALCPNCHDRKSRGLN
ncbi:MAG: hypothetical protein AUI92_04695 [Thaumarchaeota archaeon 13_1_40CM_3_38_6]|nr:MAG: hypothetical protein AUI92_04695 [Thaumarchaeota archaeon 13_1_40CM_3_38_6]OLD30280.1 MAG: hypothetical protein AUI62_01720 [Thaumarchaeota archaeon 13_1_40CM_2_39_7]